MDKENKLILYKDEDGRVSVNIRFADEDVWLTQAQLVEIYQSSKSNSSERNFYQQVTDIYATSTDYDPRAKMTRLFFATVQNKMHYAVHEHTAAELIYERVDNEKPFVGMTNFKGNYVTRDDVKIAKNYLTEQELTYLNLLVSQYLDFAEIQALQQMPMKMVEWIEKLDELMKLSGRQLLVGKGTISHEEAKQKAIAEFEKYRKMEMIQYESDYDRAIRELIDKEKEGK